MEQKIKNGIKNNIDAILESYKNIAKLNNYSCHFIDVPEIDTLLQDAGREILKDNNISTLKNFDKNLAVFVTTTISKSGGGTRMIEDWTRIYQSLGMECVVIVTATNHDLECINRLEKNNIQVLQCIGEDIFDLTSSFQNFLISLRPEILFLCSFAMDVVALCGIQKILVNKLYLNLVLDHGVSSGIHIPYIDKIVTYRPYLMHYLQDFVKIDHSKLLYIPLSKIDTVTDLVKNRDYMKDGYITTASSTSNRYKISDDYKYKYTDAVVKILKITRGKHVHIGDIGDEQIFYIRDRLEKNKLDSESFILIKHTSCLAKTLIENNVDILLQTFPSGGGLTSVEAMQAGIKIISHVHAYSYLYNASDMLYYEAFFWHKPVDLYNHIQNLTKEEIAKEGKISRQYFEQNLNIKNSFSIDGLKGMEVDYEGIKKKYSYALDYFSYLQNSFPPSNRNMSIAKSFEKNIIRPFFHKILSKDTRIKIRKFLIVKKN